MRKLAGDNWREMGIAEAAAILGNRSLTLLRIYAQAQLHVARRS